ncbi:MAG: serine/threonine protein kinase [Myxococcales bacterium]|nr:serine/threonine protein kinase [Myxococcales bacterium]
MSRELYHSNCPSCGSDISQVRSLLESGEFTFCPRCQFPLSLVAQKYRLLRLLGEGGFGKVYLAEHVWLDVDRERVIKVIKSEVLKQPGMEKRFRREVQTTASVSRENEHIVRVYDDFGEEKKLGHFYVMEYLQGITLEDFLLELDDVPGVDLALHIFAQICEAMEAAHKKGIIHRDLKPSNIFLIQRKDDPYFVKIFDFGVAKPVDWDQSLQLTRSPVGTPAYMSPEQCRNKDVDGRADLYSLGIILYELLVGQTPFLDPADPPTMPELIRRHISAMPPPLADIWPDHPFPPALEAAVMTAIEKRPEDRHGTIGEFVDAVKRAIEGTAHSAAFHPAGHQETVGWGEDSSFAGDQSFIEAQAPGGVMLDLRSDISSTGSSVFGSQVAPSAFASHNSPQAHLYTSNVEAKKPSSGNLAAIESSWEASASLKRDTNSLSEDVLALPHAESNAREDDALFTPIPASENARTQGTATDLQERYGSKSTGESDDSLKAPNSNDIILFPPASAAEQAPLPSSAELAAAISSERSKIRLQKDPALQQLLTSLEAPIDAFLDEEEVPTYVMEPLAIPAYLQEESERRAASSDVLVAHVDLEADQDAWKEEIRSRSKPLHSPMGTGDGLLEGKAVPVRHLAGSSSSMDSVPEVSSTSPQKAQKGVSVGGVVMIFLSGVVVTVLLLQLWLAYRGESLLGKFSQWSAPPAPPGPKDPTAQPDTPPAKRPLLQKAKAPVPSTKKPDTPPVERTREEPPAPETREPAAREVDEDDPPKRTRPRRRAKRRRKRRTPARKAAVKEEPEEPSTRTDAPKRTETPVARREVTPPQPAELSTVTLDISTQPAGVSVYVGKKLRGKTPLRLDLQKGKRVLIHLKKKGFVSKQFRWKATKDGTHRAKMIEDLF